MRQFILGGVIVLLMGLSVCVAAPPDDDDYPPVMPAPWKQRGLASGPSRSYTLADAIADKKQDKAPAKKPAAAEKTEAKKSEDPPPKPVETMSDRQREENAWLRRQAVCRRLLEIALETNDAELQKKAEQLDERVWALYVQRTAHLPAGKKASENDEEILDRHLTPETSNASLRDASRRQATGNPISNDRGGRAAVREGKR